MISTALLRSFVLESNRIEGIDSVDVVQVVAARDFLDLDSCPTVEDLERLVGVMAPNAELRMVATVPNVKIGSHVPIRSGPAVLSRLVYILEAARMRADPVVVHWNYEMLHPFTDGNGRTGRLLWLWQMVHQHRYEGIHGFLRQYYYQTFRSGQDFSL